MERKTASKESRASEHQLRKKKVATLRLASPRYSAVERGAAALTQAEDQLAHRMDPHMPSYPLLRLRNSQGGSFSSAGTWQHPKHAQQLLATKVSFSRVGFDCDLNDPSSLADALSERCDSLSARSDLLNVLRLLLLAPQPTCAIRNQVWDSLQHLCALLILPSLTNGYRLTLERFLAARDQTELYQDARFCEDRARQLAQTRSLTEQVFPPSVSQGSNGNEAGEETKSTNDTHHNGKGKEPASTADLIQSGNVVGADALIFHLPGELVKVGAGALSRSSNSSLSVGSPPPPPPPPSAAGGSSAPQPPPPPPPNAPRGPAPPPPPPPPGGGPAVKPVVKRNVRRLNWKKVPRNQVSHTTFGRKGAIRDVYLDTNSILKVR
jgi:hypothetical protein